MLPKNKKTLLKEIIANLTFENFNHFIKDYFNTIPDDFDIIVLAPPGHRMLSYSEKTVRDWITNATAIPVVPYNKPKIPKELMKPVIIVNLKESTVQKKSFPEGVI